MSSERIHAWSGSDHPAVFLLQHRFGQDPGSTTVLPELDLPEFAPGRPRLGACRRAVAISLEIGSTQSNPAIAGGVEVVLELVSCGAALSFVFTSTSAVQVFELRG